MSAQHDFAVTLSWSGGGTGTTSYNAYSRDHLLHFPGKADPLPGSAAPWWRGDGTRYFPGQLFVASIAQSHMLRFLHVASETGLVVLEYADDASGTIRLEARGDGTVTDVTLRPRLVVAPGPLADADGVAALHDKAHAIDYLARSVSFPVIVEPGSTRLAEPHP